MTWQLDAFVSHLRRLWPDTHETSGWRTRNNRTAWSTGAPFGIMNHHTVSNPAEPPGPAVQRIISGWSGLPGPVYGALVVTSGAVHLVAGGPANHAGRGVGRVLDRTRAGHAPLGDAVNVYGRGSDTMNGNQAYFSVGGQHRGTHPDWPARQLDGMVAVNAAFLLARGFTAARAIQHREWTARNIDMSWRGDFRARVAALMAGAPAPTPPPDPEQENLMASLRVFRDRASGIDYAHNPSRFVRIHSREHYDLLIANGWIDVPHGQAEPVNHNLIEWTRAQVAAAGFQVDPL